MSISDWPNHRRVSLAGERRAASLKEDAETVKNLVEPTLYALSNDTSGGWWYQMSGSEYHR